MTNNPTHVDRLDFLFHYNGSAEFSPPVDQWIQRARECKNNQLICMVEQADEDFDPEDTRLLHELRSIMGDRLIAVVDDTSLFGIDLQEAIRESEDCYQKAFETAWHSLQQRVHPN